MEVTQAFPNNVFSINKAIFSKHIHPHVHVQSVDTSDSFLPELSTGSELSVL